jgi:hypothetical protein
MYRVQVVWKKVERKNDKRELYGEKWWDSGIVKPTAGTSMTILELRNNWCAGTNDVTTAQLTDH